MKERILNCITDVVIDDEDMWIITDTLNLLLKYSFCNKELKLVSVFPEMMRCDSGAFSRIVKLEDDIYFIPRMAKDIFYYNVVEKKFHALNIPFNNFQNDKKISVIIHEKNIYCINRFPDTIIIINSVTKKVKIYNLDINIEIDRNIENIIYRSYRFLCLYNQKIIWSNYNDTLTIFDIETESFAICILEGLPHEKIEDSKRNLGIELNDWIVGVIAFNDMLWFCTYKDKIYLYNNGIQKIDNVLFEKCRASHNAAGIKSCIFRDIVTIKDELWFIPTFKNKCIIFNGRTHQFEEVLDDYIKNWEVDSREYSIYQVLCDKKILLYSYFENLFYIINREDNSVSTLEEIRYSYVNFIKENKYFEQMRIKNNKYPFDDLLFLLNRVNRNDESIELKTLENTYLGKKIFNILQED